MNSHPFLFARVAGPKLRRRAAARACRNAASWRRQRVTETVIKVALRRGAYAGVR